MVPKFAVGQVSATRSPWWVRASNNQIVLVGVLCALTIFALVWGMDILASHTPGLIPLHKLLDLGVAVACGGLVMRILYDARSRHRYMVQRLEVIADMNHHIRNALEEIELTAHSTRDRKLMDKINVSTSRIQWALREVLPQVAERDEAD